MIIGFSGYAQSGKDTAADFLIQKYGYEKASFAEVLRSCMSALDPIVGVVIDHDDDGTVNSLEYVRYVETVERLGYNDAKAQVPEIRDMLQRMGTEMGRKILGENVWVDSMMNSIDPDKDYVITDVRFPNEYDAVKNSSGLLVRISRAGTGPVNGHPSETALDDFDFDVHINNDGTLEDLERAVDGLIN